MRAEKSNFTAYSSLSRIRSVSGTTNILDLIKRNKEEEKKERIQKIYTLLGFTGIILIFLGIFIYL
tara:strand:+ start:227 stop:424 length:198 start_codon:yes stop_codon:yes gene_type:complete